MRRSSGPIVARRRRWAPPGSPGHKAGVWPDAEGFGKLWKLDRAFKPALAAAERERKYAGWKRAGARRAGHAGSA